MSNKFTESDVRTYSHATDDQLLQEQKRLRKEIDDPQLSAGEMVSSTLYNAIVIGATLAPLAYAGAMYATVKSPQFRKFAKILAGEELAEINKLVSDSTKPIGERIKSANEIIEKYTGSHFEPLTKLAEKSANMDAQQVQSELEDLHFKLETEHLSKHNEKALKNVLWATTGVTFGGSSIVGTALSISQAKKDKAVENSARLTHVDRVLKERETTPENTFPLH